jgi:hypothetical protein
MVFAEWRIITNSAYTKKQWSNAVARTIIGRGAHIHIFVFCFINFFWNQLFLWYVNTNIWICPPPPNYRSGYDTAMKMVCVVFCASLLGSHICRESCLPHSSTQALPKDAKWQSIQIAPPSGDGVDQIPKGGEQKSIKCPTYAQPPPPLD